MREASSLSIAARHSRHWGEAKASLADLGVVRSFKSGARASLRSVCVFYYCRTYYKAVRVGGEESGGHVL